MKLQLTGLKAHGLRCAEIDLRFGTTHPGQFVFIQMPNGTGKTTIAECLRATLSGEAYMWGTERVKNFQRIDSDVAESTGLFEARFLFDGDLLAVGLRFDFFEGKVTYYTSTGRGRVPKHNLPPSLARFSDRTFVNLFIFDAELPHKLLNESSKSAEQAIEAFYQLYVLNQISDAIERFWDRQIQGGIRTQQGLSRHQNKLRQLRERKRILEDELRKFRTKLSEVKAELSTKEAELDDHLSQVELYRHKKAEREEDLRKADESLVDALQSTKDRLQRPLDVHPRLRSALDQLAGALDSLRLPEATSREFFMDLADQSECVCGASITKEARTNILNAADSLLEDDAAGVINALKSDIRTFHRDEVCEGLVHLSEELIELVLQRDGARSRLEALRTEATERADDAAKRLKDSIDDLRSRRDNFTYFIEARTREPRPDDTDDCECIGWFTQEIGRLQHLLAEATQQVRLRERTEKLRDVLGSAATSAREAARGELVEAMNDRLESLLPGEQVRVSNIRPHLQLENREGVNQGAMLSISYSFLTTLFERGNHKFPFIVDAPVMGLDGMARESLANVLPRIGCQFIGFILDNERDFARHIQRLMPELCEFYTIFSNTSRNRPLANQVPAGIEPEAADTYTVQGFDFFDQVQWTKTGVE